MVHRNACWNYSSTHLKCALLYCIPTQRLSYTVRTKQRQRPAYSLVSSPASICMVPDGPEGWTATDLVCCQETRESWREEPHGQELMLPSDSNKTLRTDTGLGTWDLWSESVRVVRERCVGSSVLLELERVSANLHAAHGVGQSMGLI